MKRIFVLIALLALAPAIAPAVAQVDPATAAAERELAEERHRSMSSRLDRLEESIAAFQKNVTSLRDEVHKVKDDMDRLRNKNEGAATQDNIQRLAEKLEEVDKKRLADGERTVKTLDEMKKLILDRPGSARIGPTPPVAGGGAGERPRPPAGTPATGQEKGFTYTIKDGDRLIKIVTALKAQGFKATEKQIIDANPAVNWSKLSIGQKIFIPDSR